MSPKRRSGSRITSWNFVANVCASTPTTSSWTSRLIEMGAVGSRTNGFALRSASAHRLRSLAYLAVGHAPPQPNAEKASDMDTTARAAHAPAPLRMGGDARPRRAGGAMVFFFRCVARDGRVGSRPGCPDADEARLDEGGGGGRADGDSGVRRLRSGAIGQSMV